MDRKVIIFDMDGVIVNSIALMSALTQETFPGIGHEGIKDLHKGNIHESIKNSSLKRKEETKEEFKVRFDEYTKKKSEASLYEGIKEVLFKLSETNTLIINTSAVSQSCLPILESHQIQGCFDFVATKETHSSKVEKFKLIAEKYDKELSELVFITDTVGDVREANEAGVPTIVVTWGLHQKDDFEGAPLHQVIGFVDSPEELQTVLSK